MPKLRTPHGPTVMVSARVPEKLFDRLKAEADANDRSLAQEIIRRLRMSFEGQASLPNGHARPEGLSRKDAP